MIRIVTDSTCDLPKDIIERYDITIVPLYIMFGTKSYREFFDLTIDEFYQKLETGSVIPTTSMPPPGDFIKTYDRIVGNGDSIISIHLSDKLSGTCKSARQARDFVVEDNEGADITVIDSRTASLGLGMLVIRAAEMVAEGMTKEKIVENLEDMASHSRAVLIATNLSHLAKSGRVSSFQAFIGNLIRIVPVLAVEDGVLNPVEKTLGVRAGLKSMIHYMLEKTDERPPQFISLVTGTLREEEEIFHNMIQLEYPGVRRIRGQVGSVVGTHLGPTALGVLWY